MKMLCMDCNTETVMKKAKFKYMGHEMYQDIPVCPKCGKPFIPKELAETKIASVEAELEDK